MPDGVQPTQLESGGNEYGLFLWENWQQRLEDLSQQYRDNQPFAHIFLDDFLDDDAVREAARQFPLAGSDGWTQYKHFNELTLGQSRKELLPAAIAAIVDELHKPEFVEWLSTLTGIADLRADPDLAGGGMHQTETGGFLNIHSDFQAHPHRKGWRRRCNLIIYLSETWDDAWGGQIEFWDTEMQNRVTHISPQFNRAVIFNTTPLSFHGYPQPITCPPDVTRNSLALYYYTVAAGTKVAPEPSRYVPRPEDGRAKRFFMRCDNAFLWLYSWIKRTFRLSDRFASWLLGLLSR